MREWITRMGLSEAQLAAVTQFVLEYGTRVVGAIILLVAALILSGWVRNGVTRALRRIKFDETLTRFFGSMSRWIVLLLAVISCMSIFGIETTSVAGVLTGASLAIGLAFQGSLSNIAAGVMLLTFRPFKTDQVITVAGNTGKVDEITLFTTSLNTPDNKHIIIPNGQVFGATIINFSHNATRRLDIDIGVSYDADIDHTREVLMRVATASPLRLPDLTPVIFLAAYADSSVNWQLRIMVAQENYWALHQEVMRLLKYELDAAGIEIPYPQRVLHLPAALATMPPAQREGAAPDDKTTET